MPRFMRHFVQRRTHTHSRSAPAQQREAPKESDTAVSNGLRQYQLRVNAPNDAYEAEADHMAQQVTRMPTGQVQRAVASEDPSLAQQVTPLIQRQEQAKDEEEPVQTKAIQRQEQAKDEEEQVQTKAIQRQEQAKDEEEQVQAKAIQREERAKDEEEQVQAKAIQRQEQVKDEEEPVQMSGKGGTVTPDTEDRIGHMQQGGRPLSEAERGYYEPRFGADFSGVRVHDDAESAQVSGDLNAHAFTQGEHVFFGAGQYQPHDTPGRQLMAHELTHTIQQGGSPASSVQQRAIQRGIIQRIEGEPPNGAAPPTVTPTMPQQVAAGGTPQAVGQDATQYTPAQGQLIGDTILFDSITVPDFKLDGHRTAKFDGYGKHGGKVRRNRQYNENTRPNDQRDLWRSGINKGNIRDLIMYKIRRSVTGERLQARDVGVDPVDMSARYVLTLTPNDRPPLYYFGTVDELTESMTTPAWGNSDRRPPYKAMQVDHIGELQIADYPDTAATTHAMTNFELLEANINRASGEVILNSVNAHIDRFNQLTQYQYVDGNTAVRDSRRLLKERYHLEFQNVVSDNSSTATTDDYWRQTEIEPARNHLMNVEVTSFANIGGNGNVLVFSSAEGGLPVTVSIAGDISPTVRARLGARYFPVTAKSFNQTELQAQEIENDNQIGVLSVSIPDPIDAPTPERHVIVLMPIRRIPGARYGGYIDWNGFRQRVSGLTEAISAEDLSPLQINTLDLTDQGVYVAGKIVTDVPLIRGADIDFVLMGNNLTVSKTFSTGELTVPPPLRLDNSSLTIALSTETGLTGSGRVDFGINRLGQGYLTAEASTGRGGTAGGFSLAGGFDFDTELFDPASIEMWYREGQFGAQGTLGIPSGRVRGIRSATFTVAYENNTITATGTAQLTAPGIQQGSLSLTYSEAEGLIIGGALQLDRVPGLRGGSVEAQIQRKPDGSYKVSAAGTAQPDIPGINSQVRVSYDDGIFDANLTASYARGMLRGEVTIGATNRPVDAETRRPTGEPGSAVRAYGGGQVTVQIAPWLQGTVGIRLLENGEMELSGEISLPNTVDIFPRRALERNIFSVNLDIPIVGVAVAGQRIGIFATIGGGLDANAGIGPGQIEELSLGIEYNPDHEDDTHVYGRGLLNIPADAGLRLFVRGGIGAGIPIVSATAGLEVGGQLGIQGAITAGVNVDWTPRTGLEISANASVFAEPMLRLSVDAYVEVTADLLLTEIDLYSERWHLAGVEYGSGMRFGMTFPVHYQEGQPFDISLDDVQFTVPNISTSDVIRNVLAQT